MSYTITFANGKKLSGLGLNGNNFISKKEIDETMFTSEAMSKVVVSDGTTEEIHEDWEFVQQMKWEDGTYYLCFAPMDKLKAKTLELEEAIAELAELVVGGNA